MRAKTYVQIWQQGCRLVTDIDNRFKTESDYNKLEILADRKQKVKSLTKKYLEKILEILVNDSDEYLQGKGILDTYAILEKYPFPVSDYIK